MVQTIISTRFKLELLFLLHQGYAIETRKPMKMGIRITKQDLTGKNAWTSQDHHLTIQDLMPIKNIHVSIQYMG